MDREERAAWRDAQKLHTEEKKRADEIRMAEIEAEAEGKKMQAQADGELAKVRAEAEEKKRAYDIKIQKAKIEVIQLNQIIPLRTLHHNLIELGHFFATTALQLLSYFAKYPVF